MGAVEVVIHGAGLLADKLINEKTEKDFDSVFGVKVMGLRNLLNAAK
jgi:NAD(P)-dependent dehydrogenase (short-subunit alcohol dehydrogenase family)